VQGRLVLIDKESPYAFRIDHLHDFVEGRLVRGKLVIPHGAATLVIFHFQGPAPLLLEAVDLHVNGRPLPPDASAEWRVHELETSSAMGHLRQACC